MSVREEIPDTETGINLYVHYCIKQINENQNHIKRMETRIQWCYEKAEKNGLVIDLSSLQVPKKVIEKVKKSVNI